MKEKVEIAHTGDSAVNENQLKAGPE